MQGGLPKADEPYSIEYVSNGNGTCKAVVTMHPLYREEFELIIPDNSPEGDTVHLNYNKAVASKNFTECITFTDSLGNVLSFTKGDKCMPFENRDGNYLMNYIVTDAAGQTFKVRVVYEVTYNSYISVANGPALTFEESAKFSADFDGATDVWLEDANGKIDPALYEIQETAIILKKEYYFDICLCFLIQSTHFPTDHKLF